MIQLPRLFVFLDDSILIRLKILKAKQQARRQSCDDSMAAGTATGSRKRKGRGGGDKQSSVCEISAQLLEAAVRGDVPITSAMFEIETKGKDRGDTRKHLHMTSRGQILAAVRKCLSNIAAADMGKLLLTDISKDSFLKAEIILGATRVMSFRRFHEQWEHKLALSVSPVTPGVIVHSFSVSMARKI